MIAKLQETLNEVGNQLKNWDGKSLEPIIQRLFQSIKQSYETYAKEQQDHILLATIALQAVSASFFGQMLVQYVAKEEAPLLRDSVKSLGDYFEKLADVLKERNGTIDIIMKMLVFAHKEKLLLYKTT